MKAYHIPTRKTIAQRLGLKLSDVSETLREDAIVLVEEMFGVSFTPHRERIQLQLDDNVFFLPHFPVRDIRVEDPKIEGRTDSDERLGILIAELPRDIYLVSYEVGYEDGQIPAVLQLALTAQMEILQAGVPNDEEIGVFRKIWAEQVKKVRERRDALKASREEFSKGSSWYQQSRPVAG